MPPRPLIGPMDIITGVAATAVGGWMVACFKGHAVGATLILGSATAALYLTAPARKYPTAEDVVLQVKGSDGDDGNDDDDDTDTMVNLLQGRVAIVTGATSGIGVETARVLAKCGAHVYLTGRNPQKLAAVKEKLRLSMLPQSISDNIKLSTLVCDLNDLTSVQAAAQQFLSQESACDLLINNAGVMALPTRQETAQGLEAQVGICHVGHFYLTQQLLPALQQAAKLHGSARVVALSSSAHSSHQFDQCVADEKLDTVPYHPWTAYGNAKAANLLFAKGFNNRYGNSDDKKAPIYAFSVMPGGIFTGLQSSVSLRTWINYMVLAPFFFKTIEQGAATTILCATAPLDDGKNTILPGEYHDNCAPKPEVVTKVVEYCKEQRQQRKEEQEEGGDDGAGDKQPDIVEECWTQTERLLKELGF